MPEQTFKRGNRWVPLSQLRKERKNTTKKEIVEDVSSKEELKVLREKKKFLETLSKKELKELAKGFGIKNLTIKNKTKLKHEILLASQ